MPVDSKQAYKYLLNEIDKLGNENKMRSMLSKYMLDTQDPDFLIHLAVCLLTEMRQELEKGIDWDEDEEAIARKIHKRMMKWNLDEMRKADVVIKNRAELAAEQEESDKRKAEKQAEVEEDQKRRAAAKKASKNAPKALIDAGKPTKVIGKIGGYTLESAI